jgi:hypothetical protein
MVIKGELRKTKLGTCSIRIASMTNWTVTNPRYVTIKDSLDFIEEHRNKEV